MRVLQHCQIVWQNNVNAFWNLVFYEECLSITPLLINHPLQILYLIAGAECIVQPAASRKHSRIWGRQRYLALELQNVELQCFWTNFSSVAAESRSARLSMLQGLQTIKTDPLPGYPHIRRGATTTMRRVTASLIAITFCLLHTAEVGSFSSAISPQAVQIFWA